MNKFYIVTNRPKDPDLAVTNEIMNYLTSHGADCRLRPVWSDPERDYRYTDPDDIPSGTDCIIVLGGDGTLIRTARDVADLQIPVLGVNLGNLGYLAELDKNSMLPALDALLRNEYQIEKRMMLEGTVKRGEEVLRQALALNDAVIGRTDGMRIMSLDISVNGAYLNNYRADGMIVATPTGSTGYSLSAGGPIIAPEADLFLLTPIAPHTLNTRGIILPPESLITVHVGPGRDNRVQEAMAYFDGSETVPMRTGDRVEIRRAHTDVRILKIHHDSFLDTLRRKLAAL